MSLFPLPEPPKGKPYKNFCEKGGRFGPHNVNQEIHLPDVEKPGNLIYLTYFNAGLRVYNIKDPLQPVESGWFIPPDPTANSGPLPNDVVAQTEDVLVATRDTSTSPTRTGACGCCAIPAPISRRRRIGEAGLVVTQRSRR